MIKLSINTDELKVLNNYFVIIFNALDYKIINSIGIDIIEKAQIKSDKDLIQYLSAKCFKKLVNSQVNLTKIKSFSLNAWEANVICKYQNIFKTVNSNFYANTVVSEKINELWKYLM